jgi:hypothetical protein
MMPLLWKTVWQFHKKLTGYITTIIDRDITTSIFLAALFSMDKR